MNAQQKIDELFKLFTGRFGAYDLKDGQNIGFVKRSWEVEFGGYAWDDLLAAFRIVAGKAEYERWPSIGKFGSTLDEFAIKGKEKDPYAHQKGDWKQDFGYFGAWWDTVPLVYPDDGIRRDDILRHFVGIHHGTFGDMCVRAWRKNVALEWDNARKSYRAELKRGLDLRVRMKEARGEFFANTHNMSHDEQERYLSRLTGELVGPLSAEEEQLIGK